MEESLINSIIFNISNHPDLAFVFLLLAPSILGLLISFLNKDIFNKIKSFFGVWLVLTMVLTGPLISYINIQSDKIVCENILKLNKDECSVSFNFSESEEKLYKSVKIFGNFKIYKNKIDLVSLKEDYQESKDVFVIYLEREKSLFSSFTLDELIHKKDKILKMRDEYFQTKKSEYVTEGSL